MLVLAFSGGPEPTLSRLLAFGDISLPSVVFEKVQPTIKGLAITNNRLAEQIE